MIVDSIDTYIVIEKTPISEAVDKIHRIFMENGFTLQNYQFFTLNEIETNDEGIIDPDKYFVDEICIDVNTLEEAESALEQLKNHRTGGNYSYLSDKEGLGHSVLMCYRSIDDYTIEVLEIFIEARIFLFWEEEKQRLERELLAEINRQFKVIDAFQAYELAGNADPEYDFTIFIEQILEGNFKSKYKYTFKTKDPSGEKRNTIN